MSDRTPREIALNRIKRAYHLGARELDLSELGLTQIPEEIGDLHQIEDLSLSYNNLSALPAEIAALKNLRKLYLKSNIFSNIPGILYQFEHLEKLSLVDNRINELPSEFAVFSNLKWLAVGNSFYTSSLEKADGDNQFSEIPEVIWELKQLRELYLTAVGLTQISPNIALLANLQGLYVTTNYISELPEEILLLRNLTKIQIFNNPIAIPWEITDTQDAKSILNYYFVHTGAKKKPVRESKILIIGQGSVGKTSLVQRIVNDKFELNQTKTEGISIEHWKVYDRLLLDDPSATSMVPHSLINLNVWDFGGQEIMHATHQFFLTKRSLYLLVLDSRLTQEENRTEYWLKIIQSFGGDSPVLIVGNKIDQHPLDIDRTGLQKKYSNIVGVLETSAATGVGIEELRALITEQVNNLPHIRDLLPETWFVVKTKLESLGNESNFITHDKYVELCTENDVNDESSQRTLVGFLHDLGVVLHFQDDARLEALGILNPQWVTNGVYKIINSHALFQNKGVLTAPMLDEILNVPEYPRGKRLFIVDMMKKFELCYDIEADKTFLVPDLLPKDEPVDLQFTGTPVFEYAYPVLPSSVITRFIVRFNLHIYDNCVWRTGVLLKIGENIALVKADIEDRKITIAIGGLEHTRRDTLSAIRYQLDEIHNSIKGLEPQKRVPIPGAIHAEAQDYDYLLQLERDGFEELPVKDGNRLIKINVRQMLGGVESEIQRKESGGNAINIYVGGNFDGNLTIGDSNQSIKDSYNKITSAKIDPELKKTLKLLIEAVSVMTKAMPDEGVADVTEDLGKLVEEVTKPKPSKKWYSVSIDALIKAAENVGKVGEPVINLSWKVLSLLTGEAMT